MPTLIRDLGVCYEFIINSSMAGNFQVNQSHKAYYQFLGLYVIVSHVNFSFLWIRNEV